jgi:hypothetical protein
LRAMMKVQALKQESRTDVDWARVAVIGGIKDNMDFCNALLDGRLFILKSPRSIILSDQSRTIIILYKHRILWTYVDPSNVFLS